MTVVKGHVLAVLHPTDCLVPRATAVSASNDANIVQCDAVALQHRDDARQSTKVVWFCDDSHVTKSNALNPVDVKRHKVPASEKQIGSTLAV